MSSRAFIGLGANLGDPAAQLSAALRQLAATDGIEVRAQSAFYRTPPMGPAEQPDYCNAVAELATAIEARRLLDVLLAVERLAGRERGQRWGPRRLDLDLLHVENEVRDEPGLHLPHPGIAQRAFVLVPWAEIAPLTWVPGLGRIGDLASTLAPAGLPHWSV